MNNAIARKIDVTTDYQPLDSEQMVATVTVSAPPANIADIFLLGDTDDDVPIAPGEWHTFYSVDIESVQVKGTAGDIVTVIGGTW